MEYQGLLTLEYGLGGSSLSSPGGGSFPIFVVGCAILRFETPPLGKARHRQKFDPFARQIWKKLTRKCLKTYNSVHLQKNFNLTLVKYAFLGVKP